MRASLLLSLRSDVSLAQDDQGGLRVEDADGRLALRRLGDAVKAALTRLAHGADDEERLADTVLQDGGPTALAEWYYTLQALDRRGWVVRSLHEGEHPLATLFPCAPRLAPPPAQTHSDGSYVLSRFAYLRRVGDELQLESPRAACRLVLHDTRLIAVVAGLAKPASVGDLLQCAGNLTSGTLVRLLGLLASAELIVATQAGQPDAEEADPALRCWEFHDLLFHAHSRRGRTDAPLGATFRFAGQFDPPPAIVASHEVQTIELPRPDVERLIHDDPSLTFVIESRRSIRRYGRVPLTIGQVAEFLFRVARVTRVVEAEVETPAGPVTMEFVSRPYPSGGALYEIEFYLVVQSCQGLDAGLYRYQAQDHRLGVVCGATPEVDRLLRDAAGSAGIDPASLQLVVILSARFPRLSWKYASIAYALILKHVGVIYQTMYLTATAMGLAPCALGAGDSDLFARAAGTDYYAETSVGEFLLGSKEPDQRTAQPPGVSSSD